MATKIDHNTRVTGNQDKLHKGVVKVKKGMKVFETRKNDLKELRAVIVDKRNNTKVYIQKSDTRTDNEVINDYKERYGING